MPARNTMAQILQLRGQNRANAAQQRGAISQQMWNNLGQGISNAILGYEQMRREQPLLDAQTHRTSAEARYADARASEMAAAQQTGQRVGEAYDVASRYLEPDDRGVVTYNRAKVHKAFEEQGLLDVWPAVQAQMNEIDTATYNYRSARDEDREQAQTRALGAAARMVELMGGTPEALEMVAPQLVANGVFDPDQIARVLASVEGRPERVQEILNVLKGAGPGEAVTLSPGQVRIDPSGREIARVDPAPSRPAWVIRDGSPVDVSQTGAQPGDRPYNPPQATTTGPLVAVMGPEGPVMLPRDEAVGRAPANIREQGRNVTSGDANRIAEFDTSLDDLSVLRQTLFPDADLSTDLETEQPTGTVAKIGAAVPNWVTEITGWGAGAKSRQGVIDRVKQVIGKALEGGVLRKEDEYKYTKILPTISDVPEVVQSKLAGLEDAIRLRRERLIESLADANYDVSRYRDGGATSGDDDGWTDLGNGVRIREKR